MADFSTKCVLLLVLAFAVPTMAADIWLFRHAEKAAGRDPALTDAGAARARQLATIIHHNSQREHPLWLYSTDFRRTKETIAPLAEASQQPIRLYDPSQLVSLAEEIRLKEGTVVVVGHSNTTPQLLKLLTGKEISMAEDSFDRLFHLTPVASGWVVEELSSNPR